jgi:hypothetical protein
MGNQASLVDESWTSTSQENRHQERGPIRMNEEEEQDVKLHHRQAGSTLRAGIFNEGIRNICDRFEMSFKMKERSCKRDG